MAHSNRDSQLLNFAHNVAVLRQRHGLTKTAMAHLLHISVKTLTRLESGDIPRGLSVDVLFHAYVHFGIPPRKLLAERL